MTRLTHGRRLLSAAAATAALLTPTLALSAPAHAAISGVACDAAHGGVRARHVVLLVHGYNSGPDTWQPASQQLLATRTAATCIEVFDYGARSTNWVTDTPGGRRSIAHDLAERIRSLGHASTAGGGTGKVSVVAHSMGGLATRCATDPGCSGVPDAASAVDVLVTFGTPTTGSFLRGGGTSLAEDVLGPVLSATCTAANIRLTGLLSSVCEQVRALGTSSAAKAFTPGSGQLREVPTTTTYPQMAVAGSVRIDTSLFGHPVRDIGEAGDLVVGTTSALTATHRTGNLGGRTTLSCGNLDISGLAGGPVAGVPGSVVGAGYSALMSAVTCSHLGETNDQQFLNIARSQIGRAEDSSVLPCTAASIASGIGAAAPNVTGITCHDSWAVADYCPKECVDAGRLFHQVRGAWKQVGSVLQDCSEDLIAQHVPAATAAKFYHRCGPAPAEAPCTASALMAAVHASQPASPPYMTTSFSCQGHVAVAFANQSDNGPYNPDFGTFAFTATGGKWHSHGRARAANSEQDFNRSLNEPLNAADLAVAWQLAQALH